MSDPAAREALVAEARTFADGLRSELRVGKRIINGLADLVEELARTLAERSPIDKWFRKRTVALVAPLVADDETADRIADAIWEQMRTHVDDARDLERLRADRNQDSLVIRELQRRLAAAVHFGRASSEGDDAERTITRLSRGRDAADSLSNSLAGRVSDEPATPASSPCPKEGERP